MYAIRMLNYNTDGKAIVPIDNSVSMIHKIEYVYMIRMLQQCGKEEGRGASHIIVFKSRRMVFSGSGPR